MKYMVKSVAVNEAADAEAQNSETRLQVLLIPWMYFSLGKTL